MTRDIYAHLTTLVLIVAIGFSGFLIFSDNKVPFTTQATVKAHTVSVVPEVAGYIEKIYVSEGQSVTAGEALFLIDNEKYLIAQQKAQAATDQAKVDWQQSQRHLQRLERLKETGSVGEELLEDAAVAVEIANARWLAAKADLQQASLALSRTSVVAVQDGTVTNLSAGIGTYVTPSMPVINLVDEDHKWIEADFTEKGLASLTENKRVNIVFDAYPKQVFPGQIISVDSAISTGVQAAGQLAEIGQESRWIRPQQKIRTRVLPDALPNQIIAGSRASIMVKDPYKISDTWMTLLSWMRVIY